MVGTRSGRTASPGRTTLRDLLQRLTGGRGKASSPPPGDGPCVVGYVAPGSRRIEGPDALRAREDLARREPTAPER